MKAAAALMLAAFASPAAAADSIELPFGGARGDPARGRAIVADRTVGLCLLCHAAPIAEARFQGTLAPKLDGAGARWTEGQLRQRVADARALNPDTIMPAYAGTGPRNREAAAFAGKPILSGTQIEDVVAYLSTLK